MPNPPTLPAGAESAKVAASFAPGPWKVVANSWQITTIYDAKSMPVCRLDLEDWGVDENNQSELETEQTKLAKLLAAAPEMLAALRIAEQFMSIASDWNVDEAEIDGEMRSTYDWLEIIRAVRILATGEQA